MNNGTRWAIICIICLMLGTLAGLSLVRIADKESQCVHEWKQGVSFDEAKKLAKPHTTGALFKCQKCDEVIQTTEFPEEEFVFDTVGAAVA